MLESLFSYRCASAFLAYAFVKLIPRHSFELGVFWKLYDGSQYPVTVLSCSVKITYFSCKAVAIWSIKLGCKAGRKPELPGNGY